MTPSEAATEITRLQAEANPGMGVRCARDTAMYLSRGECDTARVLDARGDTQRTFNLTYTV